MRPVAIAAILGLSAFAALAQDQPAEDSPLVKAAKAATASRKSVTASHPTGHVVTNSEVKANGGRPTSISSKGRSYPVATSKPSKKAPASTVALTRPPEPDLRLKQLANDRITSVTVRVSDLEKELTRLEQSYYDSSDPDYRDDIIQKRYEQTRKQLDAARKELADARDTDHTLSEPPH